MTITQPRYVVVITTKVLRDCPAMRSSVSGISSHEISDMLAHFILKAQKAPVPGGPIACQINSSAELAMAPLPRRRCRRGRQSQLPKACLSSDMWVANIEYCNGWLFL